MVNYSIVMRSNPMDADAAKNDEKRNSYINRIVPMHYHFIA